MSQTFPLTASPIPHPIQRLYWAEDLVRLRRADEEQRFAAPQRRGRIHPNPHQIDAVIFALRRIREGGCILADEVGLGKTIEAGLVVAQLLAEGARRILLILPKPLIGQWQSELRDLFGVQTTEGNSLAALARTGVFVVGREFAGSERGAGMLRATDPFDLCVIDEAHEIFAGIHKRFDRHGVYQQHSDQAVMADRVRSLLGNTPVLLLTATPIQNTLTELWGLVQYVEPTGTLLGSLATFRQLFCEPGANDRLPVPDQIHELRRRIDTVCRRTLRRQAQEFLIDKFRIRRTKLFEYDMSEAERALYDDITDYLLEPDLAAFRGSQRRLLLIGFLRRMASSIRALAASLENVARRLKAILDGPEANAARPSDEAITDLEDEDLADLVDADEPTAPPSLARVRDELRRVETFIERAHALPSDAKAQCLVNAVKYVLEQKSRGVGSGKVVVFTESLTTQDYLQDLLVKHGLAPGDITLFRGVNESPRVTEALQRWREEVGEKRAQLDDGSRPSREVAVRLALVHEFRTRSQVFIATEAGAKGLNLQFCETIVNYDLPWNPQRIEQRIGRCHRYRQQRDVTVINFLARDNEAQRLMFRILSEKLELFGQVLDASDVVLHQPESDSAGMFAGALAADFESQFQRIFQTARSRDEVTEGMRTLERTMGEERKKLEDVHRQTASLIESRLDASVRQVFRQIADRLPASLARLDAAIQRVVTAYFRALGVAYEGDTGAGQLVYRPAAGAGSGVASSNGAGACGWAVNELSGRGRLTWPASPQLPPPLHEGGTVQLGAAPADGTEPGAAPLYLGHPLVAAAVAEARSHGRVSPGAARVRVRLDAAGDPAWSAHAGRRGRILVTKTRYDGFEPVERLLTTALWENGERLDEALAATFFDRPLIDDEPGAPLALDPVLVEDLLEESQFVDETQMAEAEQVRFERLMEQIERYADDRCLVARQHRAEVEKKQRAAQKSRDAALGADARAKADKQLRDLEEQLAVLDARIESLSTRADEDYRKWREHALTRRFAPPTLEPLIDAEFVVS